MLDGIAYILNLKRILRENNMQLPEGIILSDRMVDSIIHSHLAMFPSGTTVGPDTKVEIVLYGFNIYRSRDLK